MITKKEAEQIYNKLEIYETTEPWWKLTNKEQEYYQWLFSQDKYKGELK